jgi:hypothetical protein
MVAASDPVGVEATFEVALGVGVAERLAAGLDARFFDRPPGDEAADPPERERRLSPSCYRRS